LQLTVILFALSMVLVFFGTVAMMKQGLWTVVDEYFRSSVVWIPFDLMRKFGTVFFGFDKEGAEWGGRFPFPGGWLLGTLMLANLVAAHLVRFKITWKRAGIITIHAGVILLMVGELVTGMYAIESTMTLKKGEKSDFVDATHMFEIAIIDPSDAKTDTVTTVPHQLIKMPGKISHSELPFDLEITAYWRNTNREGYKATSSQPGEYAFRLLSTGDWVNFREISEGAGVDSDVRSDVPSVIVKCLDKKTGAELATHFLSLWMYLNFESNRRTMKLADRTVTVDGKTYWIVLRNKRIFKDYSIELRDFEHGKYPGTDIPKDFASEVTARDVDGDEREVRIWMNNPLRYHGDSLFQHAVLLGDSGTVLQVVDNPGRLMPYISCVMVTLGMMIHFGIRLLNFLNKPTRATP
jgi:ResB-like family